MARREPTEAPVLVAVALPDGTQLRLPASLGAGFIVEVISGLRGDAC